MNNERIKSIYDDPLIMIDLLDSNGDLLLTYLNWTKPLPDYFFFIPLSYFLL